ncbi:MAG: sulfatase-like hydrolase/transferase [Endomicrobium sp.]|jgi:phosphoglycerol transferase MdoB-like AlkP superfamily enzyme|nr:sulfatase-like hydrolase/transferase [Endomicrobium sp.]
MGNFMRYFLKVFSKIVFVNIVFLAAMSVFRIVFFLFYGQGMDFSGLGADIFGAFFMGARLDAAVLAILNMPAILTFVVFYIFGRTRFNEKHFFFLRIYYTVLVGAVFILLCIDFGFYSYFQSRLNILVFGIIDDDTWALISTMAKNYNLFLIGAGFAALFAFVYFASKLILKIDDSMQIKDSNVFVRIGLSLVLLFLNFAVARGSFGMYAIGVNVSVSQNAFLNQTANNAVFTLNNALVQRKAEKTEADYQSLTGYKDNIRQAFADFLDIDISQIPLENPQEVLSSVIPPNKNIESIKPNVIFIVMESFGSDLLKYNSPDFDVLGELKKHFDEDIVFYNFLPAYYATLGSIEGAITNLAKRPSSILISQTKYGHQDFPYSAAIPYKTKGYETIAVYGGNTSWREIGAFMYKLGFDKVLGQEAMDKNYKGAEWGVFDEHLFDFVYRTLESNNDKKFIFAITTTNHPPYALPDDYKSKPLNPPSKLSQKITGEDLAKKRFAVYQYSNEQLGRFITKIKNSKYADNTIIAVTGDHNFKNAYSYDNNEIIGAAAVPFYLYIPKSIKPRNIDVSVWGSHLDIMPTLYHLSLSDIVYSAMGINLFSKKAQENIVYSDSNDAIVYKNFLVNYTFHNKTAKYYVLDKNKLAQIAPEKEIYKKMIKRFLSQTAIADYLIKIGRK